MSLSHTKGKKMKHWVLPISICACALGALVLLEEEDIEYEEILQEWIPAGYHPSQFDEVTTEGEK